MEIRDSEMVGFVYARMQESKDQTEIEQIRKAFLQYCGLDTFAMVKLLEVPKNLLR
jgi:hypothetical protein